MTLNRWLEYIYTVHSKRMELGLDRVKKVASKLSLLQMQAKVIVVAGTNGKGSTVATLEQIYLNNGYNVGSFTSPYLLKFNEQIKINGKSVSDGLICDAFSEINDKRQETTLTLFEFKILAALKIFADSNLDVVVLEVGLGGRLDAVNIVESDIALVTSVELDHMQWLGSTRNEIGREKAGVFRKNKTAIYGGINPPPSVLAKARELRTNFLLRGKDYKFTIEGENLIYNFGDISLQLPKLHLHPDSIAVALTCVYSLKEFLPIRDSAVISGAGSASLPGRYQVISGPVTQLFDVAHNPDSVRYLAEKLCADNRYKNNYAVFSMLKDKDIKGAIDNIKNMISEWFVAPIKVDRVMLSPHKVERSATLDILGQAFDEAGVNNYHIFSNLKEAYQGALAKSGKQDRIIVFGSFYTVSELLGNLRV